MRFEFLQNVQLCTSLFGFAWLDPGKDYSPGRKNNRWWDPVRINWALKCPGEGWRGREMKNDKFRKQSVVILRPERWHFRIPLPCSKYVFIWMSVDVQSTEDFYSYNLKNERLWTSSGPQTPASLLWVMKLEWLQQPEKSLLPSRLVYKIQPNPAFRRGLAPREAALLRGLVTAPRSHGKHFRRDQHLSLNWMLCVLAIQGSSPHHFWSMWCALGTSS